MSCVATRALCGSLLALAVLLLSACGINSSPEPQVSLSQVAQDIRAEAVSRVELTDGSTQFRVLYKPGHVPPAALSTTDRGSDFGQQLLRMGVSPDQVSAVEIIVQPAPVADLSTWGCACLGGLLLLSALALIGIKSYRDRGRLARYR